MTSSYEIIQKVGKNTLQVRRDGEAYCDRERVWNLGHKLIGENLNFISNHIHSSA